MDRCLIYDSRKVYRICIAVTVILAMFGVYILKDTEQIHAAYVNETTKVPKGNFHQNPPSGQLVKTMRFTEMKFGFVYILGVAGGNTSDNSSWDFFKLYASVSLEFFNSNIHRLSCCFKFNSSDKVESIRQTIISVRVPYKKKGILAAHFSCYNPKSGIIPNGVTLTIDRWSCDDNHVTYMSPFLPLKEPGLTLAVSTKAAYGDVSAEQIIEWMETYKYLGVDKIMTYYLKGINRKALDVLKYYASTGILDLYFHEPAASDRFPRKYSNSILQFYHDKQMVVFDSFERLSGYTYYGILDHDDFLIPTRNRSLKQMLTELFDQRPDAAGFVFRTNHYYLSWGPSGHVNDLMMGTYVNRSNFGPEMTANKLIYKTKCVSPGSVHTHNIVPVDGFEMHIAPKEAGLIKHFRPCRRNRFDPTEERDCLYSYERVTDTSVAEWSQRIRERVKDVRQKVFGTKTTIK